MIVRLVTGLLSCKSTIKETPCDDTLLFNSAQTHFSKPPSYSRLQPAACHVHIVTARTNSTHKHSACVCVCVCHIIDRCHEYSQSLNFEARHHLTESHSPNPASTPNPKPQTLNFPMPQTLKATRGCCRRDKMSCAILQALP